MTRTSARLLFMQGVFPVSCEGMACLECFLALLRNYLFKKIFLEIKSDVINRQSYPLVTLHIVSIGPK